MFVDAGRVQSHHRISEIRITVAQVMHPPDGGGVDIRKEQGVYARLFRGSDQLILLRIKIL